MAAGGYFLPAVFLDLGRLGKRTSKPVPGGRRKEVE